MSTWYLLIPSLVTGTILSAIGLYIAFSRRADRDGGASKPNQPRPQLSAPRSFAQSAQTPQK